MCPCDIFRQIENVHPLKRQGFIIAYGNFAVIFRRGVNGGDYIKFIAIFGSAEIILAGVHAKQCQLA